MGIDLHRHWQRLGPLGPEHLLPGLVCESEGIAAGVLNSLGADLERIRDSMLRVLHSPGDDGPSAAASASPPGSAPPQSRPRGMTRAEIEALLRRPLIARVGCLTEDGAPYVVPAWFEWDSESFWLVPRAKSVWARYLQRDGRVCLTVDRDVPPNERVQVHGQAEIVEEPNIGGQWVEIAWRMARRYLGPINGEKYLTPTLDRPRWLIRVRPTKIISWAGGGWHPRYLE